MTEWVPTQSKPVGTVAYSAPWRWLPRQGYKGLPRMPRACPGSTTVLAAALPLSSSYPAVWAFEGAAPAKSSSSTASATGAGEDAMAASRGPNLRLAGAGRREDSLEMGMNHEGIKYRGGYEAQVAAEHLV